MSFRFPPSFEKTHPEAMKNLRTNVRRLTTPFDVHATLHDIANYTRGTRGDVGQVEYLFVFSLIDPSLVGATAPTGSSF